MASNNQKLQHKAQLGTQVWQAELSQVLVQSQQFYQLASKKTEKVTETTQIKYTANPSYSQCFTCLCDSRQ